MQSIEQKSYPELENRKIYNKPFLSFTILTFKNGRREGTRTPDLRRVGPALSRLSYAPSSRARRDSNPRPGD